MKQIIIVNFKTYKETSGSNSVKVANDILAGGKETLVAVQAVDIREVAKTELRVYAQHADYFEQGKTTGFLTIEALKEAGAVGSLLNHSEHRISFDEIEKTLKRAKENNFEIILCVKDLKEAKKALTLKDLPDMIAFEVPELISTGDSITKFQPESVRKFSKMVSKFNKENNTNIKIICGAGVSNGEDVAASRELGCEGVLFASAIVKTKDVKGLISEMVKNA